MTPKRFEYFKDVIYFIGRFRGEKVSHFRVFLAIFAKLNPG